MNKPMNFGVIGCGVIGPWHIGAQVLVMERIGRSARPRCAAPPAGVARP